ncbi:MAG: purine-binding chemotaxis protein CheW, partial [Deltaproteobacteria bacterium]|nr:purine-binding chemotaxis protein CheW [Deltaproteobacteria bacterium]
AHIQLSAKASQSYQQPEQLPVSVSSENSQISNTRPEDARQTPIAPTEEEFYKRSHTDKEGGGELLQFLSFIVDDEEYALELSETSEVVKMREITEVPHAPLFIAGIISLRGEIIPVISLQKRLGLKERDITPETRMLVASHADMKMGLIVDKIMGVARIDPNKIESAPSVQQEAGAESPIKAFGDKFIRGLVHHQDRLIILLSLPALFKMEEV